jgi:hypothetical protein
LSLSAILIVGKDSNNKGTETMAKLKLSDKIKEITIVKERETIKDILIRRDGMSASEANALIAEAKEAFNNYLIDYDMDSAENICEEFFGLEPDYITEIGFF